MKKKNQDNWEQKKNYFSEKFAIFFDKKIPMLAVVVTTIVIVILYLEKG